MDKISLLQSINLFQGLSDDVILEMSKVSSVHKYRKREFIFFETEPQYGLYIPVDSLLKLCTDNDSGETITVSLIFPKEVFVFLSCNAGSKKSLEITYMLQMIEPGTVLYINEQALNKLLQKYPQLSTRLISAIYEQNNYTCQSIYYAGLGETRERLARLLLEFADKLGQEHESTIAIPMHLTREEIAEAIWSTASTCIHAMTEFRQLGLIDLAKGQIIIKNRKGLEKYLL